MLGMVVISVLIDVKRFLKVKSLMEVCGWIIFYIVDWMDVICWGIWMMGLIILG